MDGVNFPTATGRIRYFILQQDGALPHFHREIRRFLNEHLPRRWIGLSIQTIDLPLEEWSPRSPNVTPCDFFLWEYFKNLVFVPILPRNVKNMKESILSAVSTIDGDMLQRIWDG
jgi:hypothetical protein